jgi:hypothetical protein
VAKYVKQTMEEKFEDEKWVVTIYESGFAIGSAYNYYNKK